MISSILRALGFLILLSCLLRTPTYLSGMSAAYQTGVQFDGMFAGLGLGILAIASWALGLAAGFYLAGGKRVGLNLLILSALFSTLVGGPLLLPFIGYLFPRSFTAFILLNLAIVMAVFVLYIMKEKAEAQKSGLN